MFLIIFTSERTNGWPVSAMFAAAAAPAKSFQVMSDSMRPHRWQPTRLHRPCDSPGKNTGVGCHFFLQCMKVKSESEVARWCLTLSDPMDCSPPGSSIHGIFHARVLEWGARQLAYLCRPRGTELSSGYWCCSDN